MSDATKHIDSWKNINVSVKQLNLNISQLAKGYPQHWMDFISLLKAYPVASMLDIGCGCGAYYALCKEHFPEMRYVGTDYSEDAVSLARNYWSYNKFYQLDYKDLSSLYVQHFDLLHLGAFLDVMPDGDEVLDFILKKKPRSVLLGRVKLTSQPSYSEVYEAYGEIETYAYHHNIDTFKDICSRNSYELLKSCNDSYYFRRENE